METKPRTSHPADVSDDEWAVAAPYLTLMRPDAPQRVHDLRDIFDAARGLARTGAAWRCLPGDFPPWAAAHQQTQRWMEGRPDDPSAAILDSRTLQSTFTNTVTEGIVSAVGRDFPQSQSQGPQVYTNLIQHDAAINPGNSGGPLLDLNGEVVGVNTLGIPTDPSSGQPIQGIFFAIPSNTVQKITQQLISTGKVVYPYFGVSTQTVDAAAAAQAGLKVDHGEYVAQVVSGGPADKAGIQQGDVILSIDGQTLDARHAFADILFQHKPGDVVTVVINRDGKNLTVKLTLGTRPAGATASPTATP